MADRNLNDLYYDVSGTINTTGSSNAYVIQTARSLVGYFQGFWVRAKLNFTNTGAATLNVNGLGAIAIKRQGGGADVVSGDLVSGGVYDFVHDGTNFEVLGLATLFSSGGVTDTLASFDANGRLTSSGVSKLWPRERLQVNVTYYVRTDGSNSNNGLTNTSGGAFLTLQKAWDTVAALDLGIYAATIQVADGTYTGGVAATTVPIGTSPVVIQGNSGTPANVIISTTGDAFPVSAPAQVTIKDMQIASSAGNCIYANHPGCYIRFGNVRFGTSSRHIRADSGYVDCIGSANNYAIIAGAANHLLVAGVATVRLSGVTVTITGTPAFSSETINFQQGGQIVLFSVTFSGSATGKRYTGTLNAVLNSFGAGTASTYFPGNSNGTTATGAQQA